MTTQKHILRLILPICHFAFALCMLFFNLSFFIVSAQSSKELSIYKFDIKDEIGPPVWRLTKKAIEEAHRINADLILIHMNTYGGALIQADSIRTKILQSKIPVYVFIDNNAASAGALIAISCDSIYMSAGSSIGAATVVDQTGAQLPDKYQSYMRSMMRSTAEINHRDPLIAQAMVDPKVYVKGISDSGQVITFTTSEAIKYGFCEEQAESIKELLKIAGCNSYKITEQDLSVIEKLIQFLINPAVSGILIMIIIGGIYYELQTPGIGFPIIASAIAALCYFAPLYLEGLAEHWEILLFLAGLILIIVELFAIPGFGVIGIAGIGCVVAGLSLSLIDNIGFDFNLTGFDVVVKAFLTVIISMFVSLALSIYLSGKILNSPMFPHLSLNEIQKKEDGYVGIDINEKIMIGLEGVAATLLRPSGKIEVNGEMHDAVSETGYIEKGTRIKIIRLESSQLVVREIT